MSLCSSTFIQREICLIYNNYKLCWNKYPNYQIYIIGFDNFNTDKIHYMDNTNINDTNVKHDLSKEKKFLKYLIKKYNIKKL